MPYASVLEAHIEVLQGLQKVSAYTEDMFNPDEIDLQLTRHQERVIEEIVNKRFEDMQVGLDFIRPLIIKNKKLQVIIPQLVDTIYEPYMIYAMLPGNYYHLVNSRSIVTTSTVSPHCDNLTEYRAKPESQKAYTEKVAVTTIPVPSNTTPPFYYDFVVAVRTVGGPSAVHAIEFHTGLTDLKSKSSWFAVANYIMDNFKPSDIEVYWESYRDIYMPKSFIFVTANPTYIDVQIYWATSATDPVLAGTVGGEFSAKEYQVPNYTKENLPGYKQEQIANSLIETDEFYTQNLNVFYKTSKANPKAQVSGDFLMAYEDKTFLISDLAADYIRKPKHVSLSLNQNLELAGDGPRIVVDRVVEYLKLAIENPAYEAVVNDNKVRNQI